MMESAELALTQIPTGLGPMQGQSNHFFRYAPEKIQYGVDRYRNESRRLYRVLDTHLGKSKSGFIVGDHVSPFASYHCLVLTCRRSLSPISPLSVGSTGLVGQAWMLTNSPTSKLGKKR